eukprot:5824643-Alexandrium_andersonii.AAC.1
MRARMWLPLPSLLFAAALEKSRLQFTTVASRRAPLPHLGDGAAMRTNRAEPPSPCGKGGATRTNRPRG